MSVYVCSRRSVVGRPRNATHTRLRAVEIWPAQTTTAAFVWSVLRNASVFRHVPLTIDTDWLMPSKPTQPYGNGAWILQWIVVIKSCFQNTSVFRSLVCLITATSSTFQFSPEFNPSWSCYSRWRLQSHIPSGHQSFQARRSLMRYGLSKLCALWWIIKLPLGNACGLGRSACTGTLLSLIRSNQYISTVLTEIPASFFVRSVYQLATNSLCRRALHANTVSSYLSLNKR